MYLAPLTILFALVMAVGWWLQRRDERREAAGSSRHDREMSGIIKQGLEQEIRKLEDERRQLREDNVRLKAEYERDHEVLWTLLEKAEARYRPYAELDMVDVATKVDAADYEALRAAGAEAKADCEFLATALNFRGASTLPTIRQAADTPNQGGASAHSWKAAVAMEAARRGVPIGPKEIDEAIDALTEAGRFTTTQGAALKAHRGPLKGDNGEWTVHSVVDVAVQTARNLRRVA